VVRDARLATGYGRERLALFLHARTTRSRPIRSAHILRREDPVPRTRRQRQPVYPALWAWEEDEPFSLIQTDLKDIWDKGSLGTARWDHLRKNHLPRYQWTACDGRTRLRFLAFSHQKTRTNGIAFLILTLLWLRTCHITTPVIFQTDWGNEFGGDNLALISQIERRFLTPLQGHLKRYPMGRKGYNGRVERSHRSDDEEFYRPYLLTMQTSADMLALSSRWLYSTTPSGPTSASAWRESHHCTPCGPWATMAPTALLSCHQFYWTPSAAIFSSAATRDWVTIYGHIQWQSSSNQPTNPASLSGSSPNGPG